MLIGYGCRTSDMQMLTLMNARERTAQDFKNLFTAADPRFKLADIHRSPGFPLAIMEADFSEGE